MRNLLIIGLGLIVLVACVQAEENKDQSKAGAEVKPVDKKGDDEEEFEYEDDDIDTDVKNVEDLFSKLAEMLEKHSKEGADAAPAEKDGASPAVENRAAPDVDFVDTPEDN